MQPQPEAPVAVPEEGFFTKTWKKIKEFFNAVPGKNIGLGLIAGGALFMILRHFQVINFHQYVKYFTANLTELKAGNHWGMLLSPFAHQKWDTFLFSSAAAFLTSRAVARNISTGNQLVTFFGGHMIGSRLALNMYWSRNQIYISGFATGIAALEGYNISCERHSKADRKKKIFYSLVRLTLNTMCFLVDTEDGSPDEHTMKFKNVACASQFGAFLFGLAYGELYGQSVQEDAQPAANDAPRAA